MSTWTLKEKSTGDLEVTIEGDEWTKAVDKAFNKIARQVTINGFRKGQAPKALLERRISQSEREAQAIQDNANDWMRAALDEKKLEPISQPELDVKEMSPEKTVLVFTFAVEPEVKLGNYKGFKVEEDDTTVTDDEFNAELDRMRETYADLQTKDGAAENGDTVNIDYEGFKDGVAFEGGKAENYNLELGSGSFIPGFEDQLVGVKAGDEKELNLKFPEDYHADDLAGKDVVFKVKVNDVRTKVLPEIDDDFAADVNIPDVKTADDLKKTVRKRLEDNKKNASDSKVESQLIDDLADCVEVDLPDVMVDDEVQNEINNLSAQIQQYGMSLSQYLKMMGKTTDDLKNDYRENAAKTVKVRLALEAIAKAENLEPSDEDVEKGYKDIAAQYGMDEDKVRSLVNEDLLKGDLRTQKAFDFVKDNAEKTVVTKEDKAEDKKEETEEKSDAE